MPPREQTTTTDQAPHRQSEVQYLGNVRKFDGRSRLGVLEWGKDDRIRLSMVSLATGKPKGIAFDSHLNQIRKAKANGTMLTLKLDDKIHRMTFSNYLGSATLQAGGLAGMLRAQKQQKESGIQWWVDALSQRGVSCKQTDVIPKWFGVAISVALIVLALQLIFVVAPKVF